MLTATIRHHAALASSIALALGLAVADSACADDWPQWRGPQRDGVSRETGWMNGTPAEAWRSPVGIGHSTVSVVGDRVYTMGWDEATEQDQVLCLDAKTGAQLWRHAFPAKRWDLYHQGGTNCTPSIDGGNVYITNREGKFMCLSAEDGTVRWQKDMAKEYGVKPPQWGFAASPLIVDDKIIVCMEYAFAFDAEGKEVWVSPASYGTSYSTPVDFTQDGRRRLAIFAGTGLVLLDLEKGEQVATYPWKTNYDINAATPVVMGNRVFISSGYNHGCAMVDISDTELEAVWESKVMRSHMTGATHYDGHLYGFDDAVLKCIDPEGNEVWAQRGLGKGALMIADGKLVIISSRGELVIAEATTEGFTEITRTKALDGKEFWARPVVANGRIYLRSVEGELAAWTCN